MLDKKIVLKFNKNILKRYEHNLDGGTVILFDVQSFDVWFGNASANDLIQLIDGISTLDKIYKTVIPLYEGYSKSEIIKSFDSVCEELINKKFLNVV